MSGEGSAGVNGEGVWAFISMQGEECEEERSLGVSGEEVWVVQLAEGSAFCRGQLYSPDLLNEQQIPPSLEGTTSPPRCVFSRWRMWRLPWKL